MKKLDRLDFYTPVLNKFDLNDELQWLIELEYTLFGSITHSVHNSLFLKKHLTNDKKSVIYSSVL